MDPPAMINDGSYSLAEIWQFSVHGSGSMSESGVRLGLRGAQFGHNLSQFGTNRDFSGNDPVGMEQKMAHGNGAGKRCDVEDESAKVVFTSSGNCDGVNDPVGMEQKMAHGNGAGKRCDVEDESAKVVSTSSGNCDGVNDSDGKRIKPSGSRDDNDNSKTEAERSSCKPVEQNNQPPEPLKQDYIHVRARKGQATDSHSLAERARREKISERMKILQDMVPGCNKVIGKVLVLDEIINYIQSLQQQAEFLSMKLEAVNSRVNPGIEAFPPKDFGEQTFDTTGMPFRS